MRNQNPKNIYWKLIEKEPSLRYHEGEDAVAWQKNARAKLWELLGLDLIEKCDPDFLIESKTETDEYYEIRFSFQSEEGYYAPAVVRIPKGLKGKIAPMICLQGHSKGMHISLGQPKYPGDEETIKGGDRDFAVHALNNGYAPVVLEQRYMGECGGDENGPGCHPSPTRPGALSVMPTLMTGRTAIGERVWDISRLIDVLEKEFPELDCDNVYCMGNSGGGTATFYAACIEERIKGAIPCCAVCTYLDSIVAMMHCACNYVPSISRYFDMGDLAGLVAPRALVVVSGESDVIFPIEGAKKSVELARNVYRALGCEDKLAHVIGNGGHRFYAADSYPVFNKLVK
ncbi:MAG: hypothetical protein IJP16_06730 [Clostridia bacterium]|nr:hypothetical protein [Clostridia bacterium]